MTYPSFVQFECNVLCTLITLLLHSLYYFRAIQIKDKVQISLFFHNLNDEENVFFTSLVDWDEKNHVGV